jgi:hypothetical protein
MKTKLQGHSGFARKKERSEGRPASRRIRSFWLPSYFTKNMAYQMRNWRHHLSVSKIETKMATDHLTLPIKYGNICRILKHDAFMGEYFMPIFLLTPRRN